MQDADPTVNAVLDPALDPRTALQRAPDGLRDLVQACQTLFNGDWSALEEDVRRRRAGRPYCFILDLNLDADVLVWSQRCQAYEQARGEALATALTGEETL